MLNLLKPPQPITGKTERRKLPFGMDRELFKSSLDGAESGLATTAAIAAGLAVANSSAQAIIISGLIAMLVQAFNSSVGRFESERTDDELDGTDETVGFKKPIYDGVVQFFSHMLMGLAVLSPISRYKDNLTLGASLCMVATLVLLFLIGAYKANVVDNPMIKEGSQLVILGCLVIFVGIISGLILGGLTG